MRPYVISLIICAVFVAPSLVRCEGRTEEGYTGVIGVFVTGSREGGRAIADTLVRAGYQAAVTTGDAVLIHTGRAMRAQCLVYSCAVAEKGELSVAEIYDAGQGVIVSCRVHHSGGQDEVCAWIRSVTTNVPSTHIDASDELPVLDVNEAKLSGKYRRLYLMFIDKLISERHLRVTNKRLRKQGMQVHDFAVAKSFIAPGSIRPPAVLCRTGMSDGMLSFSLERATDGQVITNVVISSADEIEKAVQVISGGVRSAIK